MAEANISFKVSLCYKYFISRGRRGRGGSQLTLAVLLNSLVIKKKKSVVSDSIDERRGGQVMRTTETSDYLEFT